MNRQTSVLTMLAAALLIQAQAHAQLPSTPVPAKEVGSSAQDSLSTTLSLHDLDIATPAGEARALERIQSVAKHQCSQFRNVHRVDDRENFFECVRVSVNNAVAQLRRLQSSTLHASTR